MAVANGQSLIVDGQILGVIVGVVAMWRRAPFIVVVLGSMVSAAIGGLLI